MGGSLLILLNARGATLVLIQDVQDVRGALVGTAGKFYSRSKDYYVVSYVPNRFGRIKRGLHILVLFMRNNAFCEP